MGLATEDLAAEPRNLGQRLVEIGDPDDAQPAGLDVSAFGQRGDASPGVSAAGQDKLTFAVGVRFRRHLKADGVAIKIGRVLRRLRIKLEPVPVTRIGLGVGGIARTRPEQSMGIPSRSAMIACWPRSGKLWDSACTFPPSLTAVFSAAAMSVTAK